MEKCDLKLTLAAFVLLMSMSIVATSGNQKHQQGSGVDRITEITLASGNEDGTITLRSNGSSQWFHRTADSSGRVGEYIGSVRGGDFQRLAQKAADLRLFELPVRMNRAYIVANRTFRLSVTRDGERHEVLADDTAATELKEFRVAVREAAGRVRWRRGASGVKGLLHGPSFDATGELLPTEHPLAHTLMVVRDPTYNSAVALVDTDGEGRFDVSLPPGTYILQANQTRFGVRSGESVPEPITVSPGKYLSVRMRFHPRSK